jgi:hypothetical protein
MAGKANAHLYVLGGAGGPCKVGWSENVGRRAKYVPNPPGSREVAYTAPIAYRSALYAERYAHWILREHHFRNEWFNVEPEEAIDAVNKAVALDFKRVGRIPALLEKNNIPRLPKGMWGQIDAALRDGEARLDLIREAIERELKRRKA